MRKNASHYEKSLHKMLHDSKSPGFRFRSALTYLAGARRGDGLLRLDRDGFRVCPQGGDAHRRAAGPTPRSRGPANAETTVNMNCCFTEQSKDVELLYPLCWALRTMCRGSDTRNLHARGRCILRTSILQRGSLQLHRPDSHVGHVEDLPGLPGDLHLLLRVQVLLQEVYR